MRWEEVAAGEINHAIRITARTLLEHVSVAGASRGRRRHRGIRTVPPMGARLRLKASFDISGFDARTQIVLRAFKKYGVVLASPGGNWFMQGVVGRGLADTVISELQSITGTNFEAVGHAPLMISANSGQAVQLRPPSGGGAAPGRRASRVSSMPARLSHRRCRRTAKVVIGGEFNYVNGVARQQHRAAQRGRQPRHVVEPRRERFRAALAVDAAGTFLRAATSGHRRTERSFDREALRPRRGQPMPRGTRARTSTRVRARGDARQPLCRRRLQ
jgi:hypothetical protein